MLDQYLGKALSISQPQSSIIFKVDSQFSGLSSLKDSYSSPCRQYQASNFKIQCSFMMIEATINRYLRSLLVDHHLKAVVDLLKNHRVGSLPFQSNSSV